MALTTDHSASTSLPPVATLGGVAKAFGLAVLWLTGLAGILTAGVYFARAIDQDLDTVFAIAIGSGSILLGCLFFRPSWRRDPRPPGTLGPIASGVLYLLVGLGMITLGISRARGLAAVTAECNTLYAAATDSHARLAVLRRPLSRMIPAIVDPVRPSTCGGVLERAGR